ncbi:Helicase conserved C-terminal domain-containing protein [Propionibacterium cyclohexanicum]|uniref:Helicase conserved C-terminal domain-containing protein n=1 Tax=Propionibacterium cyclohexanicum TaxID=64702 RepID=A0A1H9U6X5_9ACTN|nr:DEAD/DEAH box helicase [Propionibacterium cyclohexanicum]SES04897.1 Helicase conserved C-terminal domain-containing protein [Propionibacterium cyclohexanicum]
MNKTLTQLLPSGAIAQDPDVLYSVFNNWVHGQGIEMYPHQSDALVDLLTGANTIITTPTGSGKSLIATAAHFVTLAQHGRSYYTAPIKALVNEKFFALCEIFGSDVVGMVTGDASVNPQAPIICCTAEILANIALRQGADADVDLVIMDEFHFIADPDRGWAWQVGLSELPDCQFVVMSATLGDVTRLAHNLGEWTGRQTSVIGNAERPVPLTYHWSISPLHETIEELASTGQSPVYIVHPSQAAATEQAQALMSAHLVDTEHRRRIVAAIGGFRFSPGFGATLSKMLRHGIGVHHAGMLPKYRRLVEQLAQQGLLVAICGTDTLGVGINVPIHTVLFTSLSKFDGRRSRLLRSREFHQIAGRAGRAGFDTIGYVVAQAPEYQVENERIAKKFENDERKRKSVRRKKPPEGFVNYTEATFRKLIESVPETLHARMRVTHAMLINLLARDEDTAQALVHIVDAAVDDRAVRRRLLHRAVQLGRSMIESGVVVRRTTPTAGGRRYELNAELQDDFAMNQPLSAFAMAVLETLDPASQTFALDVVSVIEATLEDPWPVLRAQQFEARGEAVAEMKAEGMDYEDRMTALEEVSHPQPLAELLEAAYTTFTASRPWLVEYPLHPKSVVREMYERAMTFGEYCAFHKVQRSEGTVLRYLSDAYRALRQTVPISAHTPEFDELLTWLGTVVRMTDSSLLDEWTRLGQQIDDAAADEQTGTTSRALSSNPAALRVLVRNALFRRVQLAADDDPAGLAALNANDPLATFGYPQWDAALGDYWDDHDEIGVGAQARGPQFFSLDPSGRTWAVRQVIDDPEGDHDWAIQATVDLDACDETGDVVVHVISFGRIDGLTATRN